MYSDNYDYLLAVEDLFKDQVFETRETFITKVKTGKLKRLENGGITEDVTGEPTPYLKVFACGAKGLEIFSETRHDYDCILDCVLDCVL